MFQLLFLDFNIDFSPLFDFFDYIVDFFNKLWDFITHAFTSLVSFFEVVLSSLSITGFLGSGFLPVFISGFVSFAFAIAIIKLLITLGGYTE